MDPAYWQQQQQQQQQQHSHQQQQQLQPPWPALVPSPPGVSTGDSPYVQPSHPPQQPALGYSWQRQQSEHSPYLPYQQPIAGIPGGAAGMHYNTPPVPLHPYMSGGGAGPLPPGAHPPLASSVQPGVFQQHQAQPLVGLHSSAGQFGGGSPASVPPPSVPSCNNNSGSSRSSYHPAQMAMPAAAGGGALPWPQYGADASHGGRAGGGGDARGGWAPGSGYPWNEGIGRRPSSINNSTSSSSSNTRPGTKSKASHNRWNANRSQKQQQRHQHQQHHHHYDQHHQHQQQQQHRQQQPHHHHHHHHHQQQQQQQQQHHHHHHHHVPWHQLHQQKRQTSKQRVRAKKKETRRLRSHPSLPTGPPASAACMKALGLMAVSGFIGVSGGLEGTCVELSNACREGAPWFTRAMRYERLPLRLQALRGDTLPLRLQRFWPRRVDEQRLLSQLPQSRLIERRVVKSVELLNNDPVKQDFIWPAGVEKVRFSQLNRDLGDVSWPPKMREIRLASRFSHPIEHVVWPKSLRVLHLGDMFNSPVEDMVFPDGLQEIHFSWRFDQPIARVRWPSQLRLVEFGSNFNRPLDGVTWPDTLKEISLKGDYFNQPIHVTPLPRDLEVLSLGDTFDQPLDNVVWPKGLKKVAIGYGFTGQESPQLANVVWPSGLQEMKAPAVDMGRLPKECRRHVILDPGDELDYFMFGNVFDPWWLGGAGIFEMLEMGMWDSDSE